jgi:hypothetical protein
MNMQINLRQPVNLIKKQVNLTKKQRGQALVEHIYLWPVLVFLVLGILQFSLFYRDKAIVNDATFRAAREGSLNHAFVSPMINTFVESLAPLYMSGRDATFSNYLRAVGEGYAKNLVDPTGTLVGSSISGVRIEVLSPNVSVLNAFGKETYALEDNCESKPAKRGSGLNSRIRTSGCKEVSYFQIPNDNLNIRELNTQSVQSFDGTSVNMNLQDANLLKIRGHWCAPLEVPLVGGIVYLINSASTGANSWNQSWIDFYIQKPEARDHVMASTCTARNTISSILSKSGFSWGAYFIPITSDAVVRMQSPIRCEGSNPLASGSCANLL